VKRTQADCVSKKDGFTLVEVLIALAIAAIGFGVVLHSVGLQMTLVATSVERHQMLMFASEVLETSLSRGTLGDEVVDQPISHTTRKQEEEGTVPPRFFYALSTQPVTADPRIQQVSVIVRGDRGQVRLSAYRLRVRRDKES
jgi:prepilin-type N-terminal cleavage/methylation domain-containing protein